MSPFEAYFYKFTMLSSSGGLRRDLSGGWSTLSAASGWPLTSTGLGPSKWSSGRRMLNMRNLFMSDFIHFMLCNFNGRKYIGKIRLGLSSSLMTWIPDHYALIILIIKSLDIPTRYPVASVLNHGLLDTDKGKGKVCLLLSDPG